MPVAHMLLYHFLAYIYVKIVTVPLVQYPSRHPVGFPPVVAIHLRSGHPCGGRGMDEFAIADIDAHMAEG